ncbi:UNVERIFIED_CONTAM: hypothetical protein HHA_452330 [Hammondia hammondi]|eukprot:XP_008885462.1 hypothetical protein HHA_452330 [Hammondia hammondi]
MPRARRCHFLWEASESEKSKCVAAENRTTEFAQRRTVERETVENGNAGKTRSIKPQASTLTGCIYTADPRGGRGRETSSVCTARSQEVGSAQRRGLRRGEAVASSERTAS